MAKTAHKKRKKRKKLTSEQLRQKLKLKHLEAKKRLSEKHPKVEKFFKERGIKPGKIREHSAKLLGAGILAGSFLFSPPSTPKALPAPQEIINKLKSEKVGVKLDNPQKLLVDALTSVLPKSPRPLERNEEKVLEQIFENITGVRTRATLEGEHLNTTYGYIGAEQHLRRYPGDTLRGHGEGEILRAGITPGLGAWGYFAPSKEAMTRQLEETEKWYAVVQTLYLPDWNKRQPYLRNWYKYRKVLIVNRENGNAIVAAIADSGPAAWTGKHFGGSPEVMHYLGGTSYKKGAVIVFFVDDPENKVPLGPVEYGS
jgi:hypothetical protein